MMSLYICESGGALILASFYLLENKASVILTDAILGFYRLFICFSYKFLMTLVTIDIFLAFYLN